MADIPRVKFSSPWTVANIETELNGVKTARGSGTLSQALAAKQDALTFDATPTENSTNPVYSGGVFTAIKSTLYGIGTAIQSNADLNDFTTPGVYTCATVAIAGTLTHSPTTTSAFRLDVKYLNNSNRIRQELYPLRSDSAHYVRTYTSSGWGNWYMFEGTEITPPSPTPADCPFECDLNYFVDSQVAFSINGFGYQKTYSDYAIGMIIQSPVEGGFTFPLFLSPIENAVKYSYNGVAGGSITYGGVTWYYSTAERAQGGYHTGTGLANYPDRVDYPYTTEGLTAILQAVHAVNKTVS